jgi:hypothetical protein
VCKLVGSDVTVHLSSKSLAEQDSTRPHARQARCEESEIDADGSVENAESDAEDEDVLDNDADRARVDSLHDLTAQDWKRVAAFTDVIHERYPHFDIDQKGKLSVDAELTPCAVLLAFLPLDLISERFNAWRQHAEAAGRAGLKNIDRPMFLTSNDFPLLHTLRRW